MFSSVGDLSPYMIFTDGALEDSRAGIGGVLYSPSTGKALEYFGGEVPSDILSS